MLKRIKKIVRTAVNKSSWVRLMISYHLEFLYTDLRSESKKIEAFLKNEEKERAAVLENYKVSDVKGREVYQYLLFCDRLSLILCKDETPSNERTLEINKTIGKQQYMIKRGEDDSLIVTPWIFEHHEFIVDVEERLLEQNCFKSSKEFEEVLMNTQPQVVSWRLVKG